MKGAKLGNECEAKKRMRRWETKSVRLRSGECEIERKKNAKLRNGECEVGRRKKVK